MAPSPWREPAAGAVPSEAEVDELLDPALDIAEAAIGDALAGRRPGAPSSASPALDAPIGVFVTLKVAGELNGCVGTVAGDEPVGRAVARLAVAAAFDDPRLPRLRPADVAHLTIGVSLLSPLVPLTVGSRAELLAALRPGRDGLVVAAGRRRGLFLPSVWAQFGDPGDFCDHLWRKAGLPPRRWPADLRLHRFTARYRERPATAAGPPVSSGRRP